MTTGVWNGTSGPVFGHSGVQETLLTPVPQKPRLIRLHLHDTVGVTNMNFWPGLIDWIFSILTLIPFNNDIM
jgi:hypothetical protein